METKQMETKQMETDDVVGLDADGDADVIRVDCGKEQTKSFLLERRLLSISKLISTALEQDPSTKTVTCALVEPCVFEKIVPYMEHHKGSPGQIIPYPAKSEKMIENCSDPWDAKYVDELWEDRDRLYKVMMAANYLDIRCLLHLCACKVGTAIKGASYDKIKDILLPEKK